MRSIAELTATVERLALALLVTGLLAGVSSAEATVWEAERAKVRVVLGLKDQQIVRVRISVPLYCSNGTVVQSGLTREGPGIRINPENGMFRFSAGSPSSGYTELKGKLFARAIRATYAETLEADGSCFSGGLSDQKVRFVARPRRTRSQKQSHRDAASRLTGAFERLRNLGLR